MCEGLTTRSPGARKPVDSQGRHRLRAPGAMDVGQLLATFKPLPESRISPLAATLPERNSWPKKDNLRPIHPPLEASYAVLPFRQVTRDKLSITVTKLGILRF